MAARLCCGILPALALSGALAGERFCPGEQENARRSAQRIDAEWPQRPAADEVSEYVQKLGERLSSASDPWRFVVLRDRAAFAFAIGYGQIYITEGAVALSRTESELAAILAHEIGHQRAGHFCQGEASNGARGRQASVGSLTQILDMAKEQEADRHAVKILRDRGLDPYAMLDIAQRLSIEPNTGHSPGDGRRLAALNNVLSPFKKSPPRADSAEFRRARQTLAAE